MQSQAYLTQLKRTVEQRPDIVQKFGSSYNIIY